MQNTEVGLFLLHHKYNNSRLNKEINSIASTSACGSHKEKSLNTQNSLILYFTSTLISHDTMKSIIFIEMESDIRNIY